MIPRYLKLTDLGKLVVEMSPNTTRQYVREMESHPRYKDAVPSLNLGQVRYSVLCFFDYLQYRERLKDKNLSKFVPPYNPVEVARTLGMEGSNAH